MAIFTRYGSRVLSVEWFDEETGYLGVVLETEGGYPRPRVFRASDMKADGGIAEMVRSAKAVRNPSDTEYPVPAELASDEFPPPDDDLPAEDAPR